MSPFDKERPYPRVLLIDDDAISREVLQMLLEMEGFPVETAEDGRHGLGLLEMWSDNDIGSLPGVILMDTQMPGLSGVELVRLMRQFSTARIVAISGSDPGEAIKQATDGFLLKPIEAEDLVKLLDVESAASTAQQIATIQDSAAKDAAVIDPLVLGKLRAMMPAKAIDEIYQAVAADLETRLASLESAMGAADMAEVKRIGHAIKGGCAMVGLSGAMEAAGRLETSNAREAWPKELLQLKDALAKLKSILGGGLPW